MAEVKKSKYYGIFINKAIRHGVRMQKKIKNLNLGGTIFKSSRLYVRNQAKEKGKKENEKTGYNTYCHSYSICTCCMQRKG
jgi:hypothetical protein